MKVAVLLPIYLGKAKTTLVAYGKWFETLVRLVKQNADLKTSTRPNVASFTKIAAPFQQVCRVYPRESRESTTVSPGLHVIRRGYLYHFLLFFFIMATERERSDEAACDTSEQQTNTQLQNGTAGNNVQQNDQPQQQQQQQQQGSMWKSFLVRMFIFWLISNLFRGRQQSTNTSNTAPSTNLFKTDQKIVS